MLVKAEARVFPGKPGILLDHSLSQMEAPAKRFRMPGRHTGMLKHFSRSDRRENTSQSLHCRHIPVYFGVAASITRTITGVKKSRELCHQKYPRVIKSIRNNIDSIIPHPTAFLSKSLPGGGCFFSSVSRIISHKVVLHLGQNTASASSCRKVISHCGQWQVITGGLRDR